MSPNFESVCPLPTRSSRIQPLTQGKTSPMLTRQNCSPRLETLHVLRLPVQSLPSLFPVTGLFKCYISHLSLKMLWREIIAQWGSDNLYWAPDWGLLGRLAGLLYFSNFLVHLQETVVGVLLPGLISLNICMPGCPYTCIPGCPSCFYVFGSSLGVRKQRECVVMWTYMHSWKP